MKKVNYTLRIFLTLLFFPLLTLAQNDSLNIIRSNEYFQKGMTFAYHDGCYIQQLYYDSALMFNPENDDVYYERATHKIVSGAYLDYFPLIDKAVELNPLKHLGYRGYVRLFFLKDFEGASNDLIKIKELSKTGEYAVMAIHVDILIGLSYAGLKKYPEAIRTYQDFIEKTIREKGEDWVDPYVFVYKAIAHYYSGQMIPAMQDLDKALKYYEQCAEAHFWKARILNQRMDQEQACQYLNSALNYAQIGYYKKDPFKDLPYQLYIEDINSEIGKSCK